MAIVQLREMGEGAVGIELPADALARLGWRCGDTVHLAEHLGGFLLSLHEADFERQVQAARSLAREHWGAFHALARPDLDEPDEPDALAAGPACSHQNKK